MGQLRIMEKGNETLGRERCANIDSLVHIYETNNTEALGLVICQVNGKIQQITSATSTRGRTIHKIDGTTVENKGKLILTEIFPSVQKHDI